MKFALREFQKDAVRQLLRKLTQAKRELIDDSVAQAITLSAPTASGKTVMMTSLIERVLFGKGGLEDYDDPDFLIEPDAVFLWLSDSPQLNQQSLEKMSIAASGELLTRLEPVESTFDAEFFMPGRIYFLNSQKLSSAGLLTRKGDGRQFSIWEIINNTIERQASRFYVVIDEAHRGMRRTAAEQAQANSIIQKFIFGSPGELSPAPIVIGISATPERFDALLPRTRTSRGVNISADEPREAGLIKDFILMCHSDDDQPTEWTLLAGACLEFRRISGEWDRCCRENNEQDIVLPVLVIQVEDAGRDGDATESRTSLAKMIEVIQEYVPGLTPFNFAHCLQSGRTINAGELDIRYVEPHRVEHDKLCRVVIFKMALTTGWDCPRAEVMMSFRRAEDATYIAQLVGRIVRTPLTRRMEGNDLLNSVMLFLPFYDRAQVQTVVDRLQGEGGESKGADAGDQDDFQTLNVAPNKEALLDVYRTLPTYTSQEKRKVADIRRALRFAGELALEGWQAEAMAIRSGLRATLLNIGAKRREDDNFRQKIAGLSTVTYRMLRIENGALKPEDQGEQRSLSVTEQDVETVFARSFVTLTEELARAYVAHRYNPDDPNAEFWRDKLELFLLSQDESVVREVEKTALSLIEDTLEKKQPDIAKLSDERKAAYRRIMRTSRHFKAQEPSIPEPLRLRTDKRALELSDHLFISENGQFKAALNEWESIVLAAAKKTPGFAGWFRNYPRKPWSVAYTYDKKGAATPGYPDFVVFFKEGDQIRVDLLEPHFGTDSLAKAHGMSRLAENHGEQFRRIDWIRIEGTQIKRLNLNTGKVRQAVLAHQADGALGRPVRCLRDQ